MNKKINKNPTIKKYLIVQKEALSHKVSLGYVYLSKIDIDSLEFLLRLKNV